MYTLSELESKTFGELKKIGYEFNVLPAGDRRRRQSWIEALVNVNPPLLQLLEASPAASVEPVSEAIEPVVETSPGVEVDSVEEAIEVQAQEPAPESKFGRIVYPRPAQEPIVLAGPYSPGVDVNYIEAQLQEPLVECSPGACDCPSCGAQHGLFITRDHMDRFVIRCLHCSYSRLKNYPGAIRTLAQEAVLGSNFDRTVYPQLAANPIMGTVEISPAVDLDDELPECSTCFGDGYVEDEFGFVKFCPCETEPILSHQRTQRAIAQSVEKSPDVDCVYCHSPEYESLRDESYRCYKCEPEPDRNPILTGIALSDRFLATYPPYFGEICYKAEVTGQLNLLEPVTDDEPPDPDDFESLDAFREDLARWDREHPSSFDHCSDLPNSEHSEPNSVHSDPLEVSLDSFCEWAPCPADWYEPTEALEASKVMELSPVHKNSSTSDFFIPTFNCLGDRSNRSDEPPDTGIFAKLPKPKPPKFPPQSAASWTQVGPHRSVQVSPSQPKSIRRSETIPKLSRSYPGTIPKLFHRVAAGSSTQPARSPPGGDAMS